MSESIAGTGGDGRPLSTGDNRRAIYEAEEAQLLSFVSRLKDKKVEVDAAAAKLKEKRDEEGEIFRLAGIAGFKKYELQDLLKDASAKRRDVAETEERRHRFRQYLGLPVGKSEEQLELEARMPDAAKDEAFWRGDGYTAGLRGDSCNPPGDAGVHGQAWMEEWGRGQERLVMRLAANKEPILPKAAEPPAEEKEKTPGELKAEERRLKESLEQLPGASPEENEEDMTGSASDDGFDMTEDERQAQVGRQVVQAQREGAEEPAEEGV